MASNEIYRCPSTTMPQSRSPGRVGGLRGGTPHGARSRAGPHASRRAFTRWPARRTARVHTARYAARYTSRRTSPHPPNRLNTPRSQLALECNSNATQGPYNTRSHGLKSDLPLWYTLATSRIIRSECPGKPSCNDADGGGAACSAYALVTVMRYRRPHPPRPETIAHTIHIRRLPSRRVYTCVYMNAYATAVIHSPS